jgi:aspartate/tyrosine/aromatic aminotransferase
MSMFDAVEAAPPIEIFELTKRYREDTFAQKVDLGVGGEFTCTERFEHLSDILTP